MREGTDKVTEVLDDYREHIGRMSWFGVDFEAGGFNGFESSTGSFNCELGSAFLLRQVSEVNRWHLWLRLVWWVGVVTFYVSPT